MRKRVHQAVPDAQSPLAPCYRLRARVARKFPCRTPSPEPQTATSSLGPAARIESTKRGFVDSPAGAAHNRISARRPGPSTADRSGARLNGQFWAHRAGGSSPRPADNEQVLFLHRFTRKFVAHGVPTRSDRRHRPWHHLFGHCAPGRGGQPDRLAQRRRRDRNAQPDPAGRRRPRDRRPQPDARRHGGSGTRRRARQAVHGQRRFQADVRRPRDHARVPIGLDPEKAAARRRKADRQDRQRRDHGARPISTTRGAKRRKTPARSPA